MHFFVFIVTSVAVAIEDTVLQHASLTVSFAVLQLAFLDPTRKDKLSLGFRHFLKI